MNELINYLMRGEWNLTTEEMLYRQFFKKYRLEALSYPDYRMEEIYRGVYVPFVIERGKNMQGIVNVFYEMQDIIVLYYCNRRHKFLNQINKLEEIDEQIKEHYMYIKKGIRY